MIFGRMTLLLRSLLVALAAMMVWPLTAVGQDPNPPSIQSDRGAWPLRRQWTPAETRHFAKWVEHIYIMKTTGTVEQRMGKIDRILTDPEMNLLLDPNFLGEGSNPQLPDRVIRKVNAVLDCGKFTAFMPAYYAYRRALPWMSSYVRSGGGDVRTSKFNIPSGSNNSFLSPSVDAFFTDIVYGFSSGNYRVEVNGPKSELSDTVPVAIDPAYLMPGCANYVDGHCLMVAQITEYGEIRFINMSTTKTRDIYTYNGMNAIFGVTPLAPDPDNPLAGCFQGLRTWRYPIAETDSRGRVIKVRRRTDEEMKEFGFSTEQYTGVSALVKKLEAQGVALRPQSFHDYIRVKMMQVDRIVPLAFMESYAKEILEAYEAREAFVQDAWRDVQANGPIVYPEELTDSNIFQAHGRWETWSSPSSDVDRRNKYFYLAEWLDFALRAFQMKPDFLDLTGFESYTIRSQADLAEAFIAEKTRIFDSLAMAYRNSRGEPVRLTLSDIEERLYDMSFDPNHPPELRWGAPLASAERAAAPQTYTPLPDGTRMAMEEAYRLQTYYRTVGQRETEMSCLRGMFTEGFPVRDKIDVQLTHWAKHSTPTDAIRAWVALREPHEADAWAQGATASDSPSPEETAPHRPILIPIRHE